MVALACLTIAIICAVVGRVLLVIAALDISVWWAVGVFLPFGPMFFRLSYPEAARSSQIFRLATLACVFFFVLFLGPGALIRPSPDPAAPKPTETKSGYGSELLHRVSQIRIRREKIDRQTVDARRAANEKEFERLDMWNEALHAQKRDLLQSDVEGQHAYNIDLEEYEAALAKANAEKQVLAGASARQK